MTTDPTRLVLLGGGHAMLPSLARAHEWTEAGVEVTLIDPQRWLYYSGMVPEHLGGVYGLDEIRIDLRRLAHASGADYVPARAVDIDPDARVVTTDDGDASVRRAGGGRGGNKPGGAGGGGGHQAHPSHPGARPTA
mgnify:CR=1 FL=1